MSAKVQIDTIQPKADHKATVIIFHGACKVFFLSRMNRSEARYS